MALDIATFRTEFDTHTAGWSWEIEGFLDKNGRVHPIDSDTKVLSTVFERLASPVVRQIAKAHKYTVELANQTTYPDFTLTSTTGHRIALDIKTTYYSTSMAFTLGGYNSFLRNGTKNILYPYKSYSEHWILGFIYEQLPLYPAYDLDSSPKPGEIWCPYKLRGRFLRHKHEIAGLRAGSGNTKNIGSVKLSTVEGFATVKGPFMSFVKSKEACDHYWRNYERLCLEIATPGQLTAHADFGAYKQ
mgnify:CR=1 FL=1